MDEKRGQLNQSVDRTLDIIEVMAEAGQPLRLSEIAQRTGLPAATALRMLQTLLLRRYAYQEPDTLRYGLTLGFARIGALVSENLRLRDVAHPLLASLSQACRESVCLGVEEDMEVIYADVLDGPDGMLKITQRIGKRAPMHCTGIGKVLLSAYTPQALERFVRSKGLPGLTAHTLVTPQALEAELAAILRQGYALDNEECELGAACIATGVYDYQGKCVAGISVTCPSARMTPDRMKTFAPMIRRTAQEIGQRLGGRDGR